MPQATDANHEALQRFLEDSQGGFALIVSGPSGVGKSSICEAVSSVADVAECVTTTTRPRRENEVDGEDYHFVTDDDFEFSLATGAFVEYASVYDYRYGSTFAEVEAAFRTAPLMLVDVDVQGAQTWRKVLGDYCVTLFLLPPSLGELESRLVSRESEDSRSLKVRMGNARREMSLASEYDYVVVNDELESAIDGVLAVLKAEQARTRRNHKVFHTLEIPNKNPFME